MQCYYRGEENGIANPKLTNEQAGCAGVSKTVFEAKAELVILAGNKEKGERTW